jgi:Na+/H+ antiporter NhaD/arsenite permease-like protein
MDFPHYIEVIAATLFAIAVIHTFSTKFFEHLARLRPDHGGLLHLLGEVEGVFGLWAAILLVIVSVTVGLKEAVDYLDSRNFTEPAFVFVIMVVAASRPVLKSAEQLMGLIARLLPLRRSTGYFFVLMSVGPLLGSFITEPAAMTLTALLLRDHFFSRDISERAKYAIIGTLFVNVSIGGALTPYAAPPILMVASTWSWGFSDVFSMFGIRSIIAVLINAVAISWLVRREFRESAETNEFQADEGKVPVAVVLIHLLFLAGVVIFNHHMAVFLGLFLFFLGFTQAYARYQRPLILRQGLMVGFFLAGLVVLGGMQRWWLQPTLQGLDGTVLYLGATALTAITDNAALTYLGSLVQGIDDNFKFALVAGAISGGGLTVIANAPNPAGYSILKSKYKDESIGALGLFIAAVPPTIVTILVFWGDRFAGMLF